MHTLLRLKAALTQLLMLVGGGVALYFSLSATGELIACVRARDWEEVPCELNQVSLERHLSSTGRRAERRQTEHYSLQVSYSYEYMNQRHTCHRYDFQHSQYDKRTAESRAQVLESTPEPTCYVYPGNPQEAVLNRSMNQGKWLMQGLALGIFSLACFYSAQAGIRRMMKSSTPGAKGNAQTAT